MKAVLWSSLTLLSAALLTAGCSLAPEYKVPASAASAAFKETPVTTATAATQGQAGAWKIAQPSDQIPRGKWWVIFDDPALDDLEEQALAANQNLAAAAARLQEARALQQATRAGLFPTIDAGFGPTREKVSPAPRRIPVRTGPLHNSPSPERATRSVPECFHRPAVTAKRAKPFPGWVQSLRR
jgi:multidrug efflux system outer membrane protein